MPDSDAIPTPSPDSRPSASHYAPELPLAGDLQQLLPPGQYLIERFLGQGGMGAVYKGLQMPLRRPVAVKIMQRSDSSEFDFEERFRREAYAMAALMHPHIVQVFDCGDAGPNYLFISMELVEGGDLSQLMKAGGMTPERALKLLVQICDALQAAHDRGIVHRDIKPANIFITGDGRAKVADFGLAKTMDAKSFMTQTGMGMGTPDYAAPEQFEGAKDLDHRADVYALGVMMYQMLTGVLPRGAYRPPSQRAAVDPRLDDMVFKAMELNREDRYQSVAELKADILSLAEPAYEPASHASMAATVPLPQAAAAPVQKTAAPLARSGPMKPKPAPPKASASAPAEKKGGMGVILGVLGAVAVIAVGAFFMMKKKTAVLPAAQGDATVAASPAAAPPSTPRSTSPSGASPALPGAKLQSVATSTPAQATPAKPGDVLTFGGHRYQFIREETGITLSQAKAKGEAMGGHLATITSREEDDHLRKMLQDASKDQDWIFIGARREEAGNGAHRWFTGEPFTYTGWPEGPKKTHSQGSGLTLMNEKGDITWRGFLPSETSDAVRKWIRGFVVEWDDNGTKAQAPAVVASQIPPTTTGGDIASILTSPDYEWSAPVNLGPTVNAGFSETFEPTLSADGLVIVFGRWTGDGKRDLYEAQRRSLKDWFGAARALTELNTSTDEVSSSLSADGLTLYFGGEGKEPFSGTAHGSDVLQSQRTDRNSPWGPSVNLGATINMGGHDLATISPDGLTLVVDSWRMGGQGGFDIYLSRRASLTAPWGPLENVGPEVNTTESENGARLAADNRTLLFSRSDHTGQKGKGLFVATPDANHRYQVRPLPVPFDDDVNSPCLSPDGRTLWVSRSLKMTSGKGRQIWQIQRVPKGGKSAGR